jgi:Rrf2 family cysteine metabolism transcriptional repressor
LVKSTRGAKGGYVLSKSPSEIKLSEIIHALEGSIEPVECVIKPRVCHRSEKCVTKDVWLEIYQAVHGILEALTLEELVKRHNKKQLNAVEYHI